MSTGRPGDDPITDVVEHRVPVFSAVADRLIAEIVALGGRSELEDRYGFFYGHPPSFKHQLDSLHPIPAALESELGVLRERLERERRRAGWEVDRLLCEARAGREP